MRKALVALLGLAGLVAAVVAVPALAQDPTEEQAPETEPDFAARLATELDLPAERVRAAVDKVETELRAERDEHRRAKLTERLDAAVESGRLTREEADEILEAAEAGRLRGRGHGWGNLGLRRGHGGGPPPWARDKSWKSDHPRWRGGGEGEPSDDR